MLSRVPCGAWVRLQTRDKDTGDTADMTAEGARSEQAHDSIAATDEIHVSATDETHVGAERGRRVRLRTREGHRGCGRGGLAPSRHDSIAATDEIHVSATDETHVGAERRTARSVTDAMYMSLCV